MEIVSGLVLVVLHNASIRCTMFCKTSLLIISNPASFESFVVHVTWSDKSGDFDMYIAIFMDVAVTLFLYLSCGETNKRVRSFNLRYGVLQ
jgi:hypothetical protein